MKKKLLQQMLVLLCLTAMLFSLVGCNNGGESEKTGTKSYVTTGNFQLPKSVASATELIVKDDTAYLCVRKDDGSSGASHPMLPQWI